MYVQYTQYNDRDVANMLSFIIKERDLLFDYMYMRCLNKGTQHKLNSGDETFFVCYLLALFATCHFFLKFFLNTFILTIERARK